MNRFFCLSKNISEAKIIIDDKEELHHIKDVLRFKDGDELFVFDEKQRQYKTVIKNLSSQKLELLIKEKLMNKNSKSYTLTIACAIPKKSKMEDIIDKLTQVGVDRIIPLETERVIVKMDKQKKIFRHKRWEKIAISSAKQSQRNNLPVIDEIRNIKDVLLESKNFDLKLIPTLAGKTKPIKELIKNNPKSILVFIGPEGDFTSEEVQMAIAAGCIPVSLGDLVLRVETAAVAVASYLRMSMI
jgi:16S rRNA (uracil1498-N3)-methyltransferase